MTTKARELGYTVLSSTRWRRVLRPPSNPRHLALLPEHQADAGRRPPEPPHRCAHG